MVRVTHKQQIAAGKQEIFSKRKTKADCESIAGGILKNKIWRPREMKLKDDATNE